MRIIVLVLAALIFGALLLFDTTALLQLAWLCLTGQCGVPSVWIALGFGALMLVIASPGIVARFRRRRKPPRGKSRPARRKRPKS